MGSGKSSVGALVAERAGAPFIDLDAMIEKDAGIDIARLFESRGENAFRAIEARLLPASLRPGAVVSLGGGAPIDDANWTLIQRSALTVFLDVPFATLWRRIAGEERPLVKGRTRADLESLLERRRPRYEEATHKVDANRPAGVVADEILKLWSG
jgi:shikimate kinase